MEWTQALLIQGGKQAASVQCRDWAEIQNLSPTVNYNHWSLATAGFNLPGNPDSV